MGNTGPTAVLTTYGRPAGWSSSTSAASAGSWADDHHVPFHAESYYERVGPAEGNIPPHNASRTISGFPPAHPRPGGLPPRPPGRAAQPRQGPILDPREPRGTARGDHVLGGSDCTFLSLEEIESAGFQTPGEEEPGVLVDLDSSPVVPPTRTPIVLDESGSSSGGQHARGHVTPVAYPRNWAGGSRGAPAARVGGGPAYAVTK